MKLLLAEYGDGIEISETLWPFVYRADRVIRNALRLKRSVLTIYEGKLRALGIAGTIKLSKEVELEIVPKMINTEVDSNWKSSLFLLAALSKYGNIITADHIHSSTAYKDSLYDIAGRVLAREYSTHRRKMIRLYRRERYFDHEIDGEIDFELKQDKNPDGIPQEKISFDRINPYNATIQRAMKIVLPYVKEPSVRQVLSRAIQELGKQVNAEQHRLLVPSRNKEWTEIYNLSFDIISGMGSSLENGEIMSPSFIVDTWRIWEWLITIAFRIGLGRQYNVVSQASTLWGSKIFNDRQTRVDVFPDVTVYKQNEKSEPTFLVDAKYKILPDDNSNVDRADLYEAFVYCNATGARKIFLAYPMTISSNIIPGCIFRGPQYEISDITIYTIKIAFGSISKQGDITSFCRRLSGELISELESEFTL